MEKPIQGLNRGVLHLDFNGSNTLYIVLEKEGVRLALDTDGSIREAPINPDGSTTEWKTIRRGNNSSSFAETEEVAFGKILASETLRVFTGSEAAAELGRIGGQSTSTAKKAAAAENGKKGGRPKKNLAVDFEVDVFKSTKPLLKK